jgi:FKBP-type peptidyl-prolyl cis-trans isomerase
MTKPQRVAALAIAIVFLASSVAFSIVVIFLANDDSTNNANQNPSQSQSDNLEEESDMLAGTKLEGFEPIENVKDLQKIDLVDGNGETVPEGATVVAHYTGALANDGTIFQSSHDSGQPIPFSLEGVIAGWTEGVPGMRVGGKRRLIIPSQKAYGESGTQGIPPNSDLVFDIEILEIRKK